MKQKTILILIILVSFLLLVNCEEDTKNEISKANQVEYNGNTYELSAGVIYIGDLQDGERYSGIVLYSEGFNYNPTIRDITGTGNIFWFEGIIHTSEDIQGNYEAVDFINTEVTWGPDLIQEVEFGTNCISSSASDCSG